MELRVIVREEQGIFWSEVAELPGCFASAGSLAELRGALAEAVGLYLWDVPVQLPERSLELGESIIEVSPPAGLVPGP